MREKECAKAIQLPVDPFKGILGASRQRLDSIGYRV